MRGSKHYRLVGLICLLIVLATIILGSWIVIVRIHTHYLPLLQLIVTGERRYTTNDDIHQIIIALGGTGTFITRNASIIQQQIECLPWVKRVNVRKRWPNELKIHVVEYVPVAFWNDSYLLDSSGKVFNTPTAYTANKSIPMLYGPEGNEKDVLAGYRIMSDILTADNFHLKSVRMSVCHLWQLTLRDNTRLELGRNDMYKRLQRFIMIYPVLLQHAQNFNKHISYVDLRYDSGMAVGWTAAYIKPGNSNQQQTQAQAEQK